MQKLDIRTESVDKCRKWVKTIKITESGKEKETRNIEREKVEPQ